MNVEARFLFIARIFLLSFLFVNITNLIPIDLFNVFYYINFFNIFLDTSTLLLLSLSIPKFLILRKLELMINKRESKLGDVNIINIEIQEFQEKNISNRRISVFISIFFIFILLFQPLNLYFVLNKNDLYTSNMINKLNQTFDTSKMKLLDDTFAKNNKDINISNNQEEKKVEKLEDLKVIHQKNINNFIKANNKNKFNQIKFLVRNIFLSILFSFAFFKLSKINL